MAAELTPTRRTRSSAWKRLVRHVIARDGGRCQIGYPGVCLGTATEGDHIVPLSAGGAELDPDNVRASCARCNRRKGEKQGVAAGETDRSRWSREWF